MEKVIAFYRLGVLSFSENNARRLVLRVTRVTLLQHLSLFSLLSYKGGIPLLLRGAFFFFVVVFVVARALAFGVERSTASLKWR